MGRHLLNDSPQRITMSDHEDCSRMFGLQLEQRALKAGPCGREGLMHVRERHLAYMHLQPLSVMYKVVHNCSVA